MLQIQSPAELHKREVEILVKSGSYLNQEEVYADALRTLLLIKPELRLNAAVKLYQEKDATLNKAAELAGISSVEFVEILKHRGIKVVVGSESSEELEEGVRQIREMRKRDDTA